LCNAPEALGGSWSREGVIIFGTAGAVLKRVLIGGGEPVPLFPGRAVGIGQRFPQFLPDGRRFLYLDSEAKPPGIYLASLDASPTSQNPRQLLGDDSNAQFVPPLGRSSVGHLLFVREQTLMAQPVYPDTINLSGEAFVVAEQISRGQIAGYY